MSTVYTVLQINNYIKNMFENDYLLRSVQIKGELSNVKYHSSGHIYFSLKDENSGMNCVMFRSARNTGLDFTMENGQSVIVTGNVSVYEKDGRYQVYAQKIVLDGKGNLYEAYERLKQKLYEEGLFEFDIKKPIPAYPKRVGIVTAKTGAAIQDIRNIAKRRNPYVQLYLYPAKVQGEGAAATIVKGIETLDRMGMDTIIIGRGGGSIEDLWPFNEEIVARAIYHAKTPIISGTGHEIDNTIADYAADLRAPTPSAACELAIPDVMSAIHNCDNYKMDLRQLMIRKLQTKKQQLTTLLARLNVMSPERKFENQQIYLDALSDRMIQVMHQKYNNRFHRYEMLLARLDGLSPTAKLIGGYGYIEKENGQALKDIEDAVPDEELQITIWNGSLKASVKEIRKDKQ